jgi:hypothetical protein
MWLGWTVCACCGGHCCLRIGLGGMWYGVLWCVNGLMGCGRGSCDTLWVCKHNIIVNTMPPSLLCKAK